MKEIKLKLSNREGKTLSVNFEQILQSLQEGVERLPKPNDAINRVKQLNRDREMLFRLKKQADHSVQECRTTQDKAGETGFRRVSSTCDTVIRKVDSLLHAARESERRSRRERAKRAFATYGRCLGDFQKTVQENPAFFEAAWEEPGGRDPKAAVKDKCRRVARQLEVICRAGGQNTPALLERYLRDFSDDGLADYRKKLEELAAMRAPAPVEDENKIRGYKVIRAEGTTEQFARLYALMGMVGMRCTEEEDGMPGKMTERLLPDFDTFVCFDLESSGTMGTNHGDLPAEIIEIGAVRVKNGQITDRFSTLVNPGRRIVPHVAKLTGITDDMVRGKPSVGQAIRSFAAFAGNDILIGHNIRSCDIPMIVDAGKREGIAFENDYFDTYLFAEANKEGREWPGLGLETLAHFYGIEMNDAHRAWCDAEANAQLYLAMQKLDGVIKPCRMPRPEKKKEAEKTEDGTAEKKKPHRRRRRRPARPKTGEAKTTTDGE